MTWTLPSPVTTFAVSSHGGLWCVTPLGSTLTPYYSREAAVGAAIDVAQRHRPSRVVVLDHTGAAEDVLMYVDDAGEHSGAWRPLRLTA